MHEIAFSIVETDITPTPTPTQTPIPPADLIRADSTDPSHGEHLKSHFPLTPEPIHEPISLPAPIAISHESDDIDDWLMTDIDQSVDEEPFTDKDHTLTYSPFGN